MLQHHRAETMCQKLCVVYITMVKKDLCSLRHWMPVRPDFGALLNGMNGGNRNGGNRNGKWRKLS